jgi:hypothetical protein
LDFLFGISPSSLEGLCQIKKTEAAAAAWDFYLQERVHSGSTLVNPCYTPFQKIISENEKRRSFLIM